MLIVVKKVKDMFKEKGMRVSTETLKALEDELKKLCLKARDNALGDKLKTIRPVHVPKIDPLLNKEPDSV